MTRDINITINSYIADDVTYISDGISHGKYQKNENPSPTLFGTSNSSYNANGQSVAQLHKTTGSLYGVTGNITYQLPNSQGCLVFMFNNPYTYAGSGNTGNSWFYAAITNIPASSTTTYYAIVSGVTMTLDPPSNSETMNATVNLYQVS